MSTYLRALLYTAVGMILTGLVLEAHAFPF